MSRTTNIKWTQSTWNPITGCTPISPGCANCYAKKMAKRLKAMGIPEYKDEFKVTVHPHRFNMPLSWRKPRLVFVDSMGDLFHEKIQVFAIQKIFSVMKQATKHQFQVLTKRSERMLKLDPVLFWNSNIWMGVTVENRDYISRIDDLRKTSAHLKFVSFEPLLGPLPKLNLDGIDWVIVGGETGPGSRKMEKDWVLRIKDQCENANVPFFFKQWSGSSRWNLLDGKKYEGWPVILPVSRGK